MEDYFLLIVRDCLCHIRQLLISVCNLGMPWVLVRDPLNMLSPNVTKTAYETTVAIFNVRKLLQKENWTVWRGSIYICHQQCYQTGYTRTLKLNRKLNWLHFILILFLVHNVTTKSVIISSLFHSSNVCVCVLTASKWKWWKMRDKTMHYIFGGFCKVDLFL